MASLSFQSGSTWRKLGFALHSNSLAYRDVLEDNPQWNVMSNPPVGTALRTRSSTQVSAGASSMSPLIVTSSVGDSLTYFPFDNRSDYVASVAKYTTSALNDVERLNGWSENSSTVDSGYM
jgi:hypothetical protein